MDNNKHLIERLLPFLLIIVIAIVVVFVTQILLDVRNELKEVKTTLLRIESEKIKNFMCLFGFKNLLEEIIF